MQGSRIIDSYVQKINRLTSHNHILQQQLRDTKIRLRQTQDTCLKYQILLKELQEQKQLYKLSQTNQKSKINQIVMVKISQRDRYWSEKVTQLESQIEKHYEAKIIELKQQIGQSKKQTERSGRNQKTFRTEDIDLLNFKCKKLQKDKQSLEETIINLKLSNEKDLQNQINRAKQITQIQNREKQESQRKAYREKIQQLELRIHNLEAELQQAKILASPQRQQRISQLSAELQMQKKKIDDEIMKIKDYFSDKNKYLNQLLQEKNKKQIELLAQQSQMRKMIQRTQQQILQKQKKHDEEMLQVTEKMSKTRDQQISILRAQLDTHEEAIQNQRKKWDHVIQDKQKQLERIQKKAEEDADRYKEQKGKLKAKVQEYKQKLHDIQANRQANQTLQLTQSLKQLQVKEADFANYENSVTFLGRELKKALIKVEQKNLQINRLLKQLNSLKNDNQEDLRAAKNRYRKDRNNYASRIQKLERQIKMLSQKNRTQDKQAKNHYKQYEKQVLIIKTENKSLKEMIDEMQKDQQRILANKTNVQTDYRDQRQKVFTGRTDISTIKRQKWLQLQRQKNELFTSFKQREEQQKIKNELQKQQLRNQRDQFKGQSQKLKQMLEQLRKDHPLKIYSSKDKENMNIQYEKKTATLELQIEHTRQLYEALRNKNIRIHRQPQQMDRNLEKISQNISESDGKEIILESTPRRQLLESGPKGQKMVFSFNPRSIQ